MVQSAGILVYRKQGSDVEVLLTHPGGPFWAKKDTWSIPKGEVEENESLETAAAREFKEELNIDPPAGERLDLGSVKQSGGKTNYIWAVSGNPDITGFKSNAFSMEWPPKSGQMQEFPENDRAAWFPLSEAKLKVFKAQQTFLDRLVEHLGLEKIEVPEQQTLL